MHADLPWNGVIEDDVDAFVCASIRLYQQEDVWTVAQQNGFVIINRIYNKKELGHELLQLIATISEDVDQHRLNNFTGAMLMHHTMQSTQYMSRWIEAKNKIK